MPNIRFDVDALNAEEFEALCDAVEARKARETFGFDSLEDMAESVGRIPICPECGCGDPAPAGSTEAGARRYGCRSCGTRFGLLSGSVLSGAKLPFWKLCRIIEIMPYNVPLDVVAMYAGCHRNTALPARRKMFEAVAGWQAKVRLSGTVFIDEIYVFDSIRPKNHFGPNRRGLNKDKCCVSLAVDSRKNMVAFFVGHG